MREDSTLIYLLKPGELTLKGGNRALFERALLRNLARFLRGTDARVVSKGGRFYVQADTAQKTKIEEALDRLFGISGWASALRTEKTPEAVAQAAVDEARTCLAKMQNSGRSGGTFKIEARRTDKGFPLRSYELCCLCGNAISSEIPQFRVDVHKPDVVINVEIRERAYIYGWTAEGRRGLPVGTASRGLLLLSGGIDSPVAGYLMLSRGMSIDAVYYHAYPYTSEDARQKVVTLARTLGRYAPELHLFTISFTDVEKRIQERAPQEWATVLLRMAMVETAAKLARERKCKCLITGESLSQVASQTVENITVTGSLSGSLPIFRPLIGIDKEEIVRRARSIGTYETSILPYPDCCVLFSPEHPILHAQAAEAETLYAALDLSPLIQAALETKIVESC